MSDAPTVADLLAFEALPDDVQALARRVCVGESDALFDAGTDEGVSIGAREEAELWRAHVRNVLTAHADVREVMLARLLAVESWRGQSAAVAP